MRPYAPILAAALAVALAGCGDGGPLQNAVASTSTTTPPGPTETTLGQSDDTTTTPDDDLVVAGIDFGILDLPPGDPYDQYVELVDDTGTIRVEVPPTWTDIDTAPVELGTNGDTVDGANIEARPDSDEVCGEPAVTVFHDPRDDDADEALEAAVEAWELELECPFGSAFDYDDGFYTGLAELWVRCYEEDVAELFISVLVEDDHLATHIRLATEADIEAATRIIETFSFTGE